MDNRKYLLIFIFLAGFTTARAQVVKNFEQADSLSTSLYQAAEWQKLIALGNQSLDAGIDFPALRMRLASAYMVTQDYSMALKQYDIVFKNDSYNQTARYYAYLCHKYLNQEQGASYNAAYLDTAKQKSEGIAPFGLISTGIETSFKIPQNAYRGNAAYTRFSLGNRLSWRWQLDQSAAYFNQSLINSSTVQIPGAALVKATANADKQFEYYAKLSYSVSENLLLMGAFHYLNTNYQTSAYNNGIGLAGIRYIGTYFSLQGDVNWGYVVDDQLTQYNAALMVYPLGNLNLYTISRGSYLNINGAGTGIFSQALGYKLFKNMWGETSATFGNLDNYLDADALYIYNAIDVTKLKVGQTVFYQLGKNAQLQLNYTYEQKQDDTHNLKYNQNSITAGLLWKF